MIYKFLLRFFAQFHFSSINFQLANNKLIAPKQKKPQRKKLLVLFGVCGPPMRAAAATVATPGRGSPFGLCLFYYDKYISSPLFIYLPVAITISLSISLSICIVVASLSCFYFFIKFSSVKLIIHVLISSYRIYLFAVDLSAPRSLSLYLSRSWFHFGFVSMSFNIYNLIFWGPRRGMC